MIQMRRANQRIKSPSYDTKGKQVIFLSLSLSKSSLLVSALSSYLQKGFHDYPLKFYPFETSFGVTLVSLCLIALDVKLSIPSPASIEHLMVWPDGFQFVGGLFLKPLKFNLFNGFYVNHYIGKRTS